MKQETWNRRDCKLHDLGEKDLRICQEHAANLSSELIIIHGESLQIKENLREFQAENGEFCGWVVTLKHDESATELKHADCHF